MNPLIRGLGIGFIAGVAVGVSLPVLLPALSEAGRPVAKALAKHTLLAIERAKMTAARASEAIDDFIAEVRFEVDAELAKREPKRGPTAPVHPPENGAGAKVYS